MREDRQLRRRGNPRPCPGGPTFDEQVGPVWTRITTQLRRACHNCDRFEFFRQEQFALFIFSRFLSTTKESAWTFLFRHGSLCWLSEEDGHQVKETVARDAAIVSFHVAANGARIAVRTNDGHSQTIIMLAEEIP